MFASLRGASMTGRTAFPLLPRTSGNLNFRAAIQCRECRAQKKAARIQRPAEVSRAAAAGDIERINPHSVRRSGGSLREASLKGLRQVQDTAAVLHLTDNGA